MVGYGREIFFDCHIVQNGIGKKKRRFLEMTIIDR